LVRIATQTEETAEAFRKSQKERKLEGRYFRFNVNQGLEEVGLEEYKQKPLIASATKAYVARGEVPEMINQCVRAMGETPECT
jgi:hypothetical protein